MVQHACGFDLVEEQLAAAAFAALRVGIGLLGDFYRHIAIREGIAGTPHLPHAAGADLLDQLVFTDGPIVSRDAHCRHYAPSLVSGIHESVRGSAHKRIPSRRGIMRAHYFIVN